MRYEQTRDVGAPVEVVWRLLTDLEHWPDWTDSMEQITRLDTGALRVGSTARVRQPKGKPMVWAISDLTPDRSFTWGTSAQGLRFVADHRLTPGADRTEVLLTFEMSGPLAWLGALTAGNRVRGYVDMEANGLARAAERGRQR